MVEDTIEWISGHFLTKFLPKNLTDEQKLNFVSEYKIDSLSNVSEEDVLILIEEIGEEVYYILEEKKDND